MLCPDWQVTPGGGVNTFSGVLTPQDNFSGRSTTRFGIDDSPPFSTGDFVWAIPWRYQVSGGTLTTFTTVNEHFTADATGMATAEKAGAGPYSKKASDPTTTF